MSDVDVQNARGQFPRVAKGASRHAPDCRCLRCRGFSEGNTLGTRHGAYAELRLAPRAAELAREIHALLPAGGDADVLAVSGLAMVCARLEACSRALAALDDEDPLAQYRDEIGSRIRSDASRWLTQLHRFCTSLGLTPGSRATLGLSLSALRRSEQRGPEQDLSVLTDEELETLMALVRKLEAA